MYPAGVSPASRDPLGLECSYRLAFFLEAPSEGPKGPQLAVWQLSASSLPPSISSQFEQPAGVCFAHPRLWPLGVCQANPARKASRMYRPGFLDHGESEEEGVGEGLRGGAGRTQGPRRPAPRATKTSRRSTPPSPAAGGAPTDTQPQPGDDNCILPISRIHLSPHRPTGRWGSSSQPPPLTLGRVSTPPSNLTHNPL